MECCDTYGRFLKRESFEKMLPFTPEKVCDIILACREKKEPVCRDHGQHNVFRFLLHFSAVNLLFNVFKWIFIKEAHVR